MWLSGAEHGWGGAGRRALRAAGLSLACLVCLACLTLTRPAEAQADDAQTEKGRAAFARGVALAKTEQWGEALAAFEEAAASRDAPLVQFNVAYCQRALGHYVAARRTAAKVLADPAGLAPSSVEDLRGYQREIEALLVHVAVTLDPEAAALTVDGRPLVEESEAGEPVLLAAVAPPGEGRSPGRGAFTLVLDPGVHLIRAVRPGHEDAVVQASYRAGERTGLALHLDTLPARVAIRAEPDGSIVRVDRREVGLSPIEIERPAGSYQVEVVRDAFETYRVTLDLHAGQRADLTAKLVPYRRPIYRTWWFWSGAAAVVAGGAVVTYFATRPAPAPMYDGGSQGWVAHPTAHAGVGAALVLAPPPLRF